jgi:hypothetical protein
MPETKICVHRRILQKQIRKGELGDIVVNEDKGVQKHFDADVLRDIFILRETACDTVLEILCVCVCMHVYMYVHMYFGDFVAKWG